MRHESAPQKTIPIHPDQEVEVRLYQASQKIYPRAVHGVFAHWRWGLVIFTQLIFYGLPWIQWGTRQAVLFDLGARRFYLFQLVLYPQDFIYLTGLLVISALSLFLFTAVAGRLWCGYACPQTVYTELFMWVERKVEGDRSARMRLDGSALSPHKLGRKALKHAIWILIALWTGFSFVGYFTPIHQLAHEISTWNLGAWEIFWVFFYSFATWGNAGFMREQVCKYMCPYARFQSAMFDHDTLIVTYDSERGEPRGARSRQADLSTQHLGACVDCTLCVQVCPTGIDIRNGLQYECIGCGACADVCDTVMDKMGYDRGLVRYSTQNALKNHWGTRDIIRNVLRPRVLLYSAFLLSLVIAMFVSLGMRASFKVDVVKDRMSLSRITEDGKIENIYRIQVMNASEQEKTFDISAQGIPGIQVVTATTLTVGPADAQWIVTRIDVPYNASSGGSHPIELVVQDTDGHEKVVEKTVFLIPQ